MRIDRVFIDGFRNLKSVEADFNESCLTTVVIGQNGSGKSNLIEAIVEIFRHLDPPSSRVSGKLRFTFEMDYIIRGRAVRVGNREGTTKVIVDDQPMSMSQFQGEKATLFPDLIFGYYSGTGRRLEKLFDDHQSRYYGVINKDGTEKDYQAARIARRMFYCRPVHGIFALLSHFAKPSAVQQSANLLREKLGITGFHSALAHFKEPSWFNHTNWKRTRSASKGVAGRGRRSYNELGEQAFDVWGARGPAGECARALQEIAFHPLAVTGKVVDDYRDKPKVEAQLACFIRDERTLKRFAEQYANDQEMFAALEAADISDLFRDMLVWVTRTDNNSGDVSFSDLSDGERQLLMVLGLIRVSRGKEALFLLDEPDTHLNPAWQLTYLDLIKEWTEVAAEKDRCQIIMTSHNPLTIAALEANEVRVVSVDDAGGISVDPPRIDPRGLGFAGVLTDVFGLSSSLDKPTQELIDRRNQLARSEQLSDAMAKEFVDIKEELRHLGFLYEERDKLYSEFLKQLNNIERTEIEPLSPDELRERETETRRIIEELLSKK